MSCYLQIRFKFFIGKDIVVESEAFDIQVWNPRNPGWHLLYEKNTEYGPRGKYFADFDMIGNFYGTDKTIDDISPLGKVQFGRIVLDSLNSHTVSPWALRFAQGKLREGSVAIGSEMLRCAQHDRAGPFC